MPEDRNPPSPLIGDGYDDRQLIIDQTPMKPIKMLVNWKTTASGVGTLVIAVSGLWFLLSDGYTPEETPQAATLAAGIVGAIGLIFARDGDKSSQENGIR